MTLKSEITRVLFLVTILTIYMLAWTRNRTCVGSDLLIIYNRVPKTGSTSMKKTVRELAGRNGLDYHEPGRRPQ